MYKGLFAALGVIVVTSLGFGVDNTRSVDGFSSERGRGSADFGIETFEPVHRSHGSEGAFHLPEGHPTIDEDLADESPVIQTYWI